MRRFFEEAKDWGDDIGDASRISAKSDDELLGLPKDMAKYERTVATGIPTPVLDHVIANPPQTWGIELRRKFSDLRWHVYLLDSDAERMNQNYQATFTVPKIYPIGDPMADRPQALFASHQSIVQSYTKRADILLQKVHEVAAVAIVLGLRQTTRRAYPRDHTPPGVPSRIVKLGLGMWRAGVGTG